MATSGNYLYVADMGSTNIYEYAFDSVGKLTPLAASPFQLSVPAGSQMPPITGTSNLTVCGNNLYVSWDSGEVMLMPVSNGVVSRFFNGFWGTGLDHSSPIVLNSACTNVYVTGIQDNSVSWVQSIPPLSAFHNPVPVGLSPSALAIDASGKFLYVANHDSDDVYSFSIASDGALSPLPTPRVSVGAGPTAIATIGQFIYVANSGTNSISAFSFDPTSGLLNPIQGSPFQTGAQPKALTIAQVATVSNPNQLFLFCANQGSADISAFTITSTGSLQAFPGSPLPLSSTPRSIVVAIPH